MKYKRLPKNFKRKWIKALRSGKYKQIEGTMRTKEGYCCLGVACSVVGYKDSTIEKNRTIPRDFHYRIPEQLLGIGYGDSLILELTKMNDGYKRKKRSFKYIADWIEENL